MLPYLITLTVMTAASALMREWRMAFALFVLGMNWMFNSAAVYALDISDPWWIFLPADYVCALVLMLVVDKPCRWTCAIAILYGFQCIAHGGYGATTHDAWARYCYYYTLSYLGWAQLGIMGGWIGVNLLGRVDWSRLRLPSFLSGIQAKKRKDGET
jgi:apolipoprotein N-acyltransferase